MGKIEVTGSEYILEIKICRCLIREAKGIKEISLDDKVNDNKIAF